MMKSPIQVTKSSMPPYEEYIEEIKDLWESHWLTNMGAKHRCLEGEISKFLGVDNATLFANGHLALESVIAAFQLSGEVITTPFTFASTTHAIVRNGLEPVFCDINLIDYTIDVTKIEQLITDRTTAILPVHVYGNICNVKEIDKIAKKYNLKVIYDAAHAFAVSLDEIGISNFGDASMFSFHATKVFNTIEGGAIAYNNIELKQILNNIKNFGITSKETVEYVGGNGKMNEFQAAMGICNLRHIETEIDKRKQVVHRYNQNLLGVKGIKINKAQENVRANYSYYPVLFETYNRDKIYQILSDEGINARKYFYPLTNNFECYKNKFKSTETPVAKYVADRILTLPLYADLPLDDVDRICNVIRKVI